jgi:hypothetical protein
MVKWSGRLGIPGVISVGVDDLGALLQPRKSRLGPFLVVARDQGLALDTGLATENWSEPILWPAHGQPHQLWMLLGSGSGSECVIQSVANGLVLDARRETNEGRHPLMWERHDEPWQKWRLDPSADGAAVIVTSVHTGHALDAPAGSERGDRPAMWGCHRGTVQQFLFMEVGNAHMLSQ